jgi:hypothetical protein
MTITTTITARTTKAARTSLKAPLTQIEADYAAEHHDLIYAFLRKNHYPVDEYYDVVVFGYLRAVRKYLSREELRSYAFSTIAFAAMRSSMGNHRASADRRIPARDILPFDEESVYDYSPDIYDLIAA